jgi:glucose-1-phosphate thymidylyltransferase
VIGIVLAGGTGSRLWPVTRGVSKQLLPIYDKPLIFFPIATLMQAKISKIIIITTPQDQAAFMQVLGDGKNLGVEFIYLTQNQPNGLAEAFLIAGKVGSGQKVALILGDNLFHGGGLENKLERFHNVSGAQIFGYEVRDPERYGVVEFDANGKVLSLEEKPVEPKSKYAVPGLYFYDEQVWDIATKIKPSCRGELEITAINQRYLDKHELHLDILDRGTAWLDTGTFDSLSDASSYVRTLEDRQGVQIACLEEIALRNSWITNDELIQQIRNFGPGKYRTYLESLIDIK